MGIELKLNLACFNEFIRQLKAAGFVGLCNDEEHDENSCMCSIDDLFKCNDPPLKAVSKDGILSLECECFPLKILPQIKRKNQTTLKECIQVIIADCDVSRSGQLPNNYPETNVAEFLTALISRIESDHKQQEIEDTFLEWPIASCCGLICFQIITQVLPIVKERDDACHDGLLRGIIRAMEVCCYG